MPSPSLLRLSKEPDTSFVPNVIHGAATAVTMLLLSRPLLGKLDRLILKYGMMEAD